MKAIRVPVNKLTDDELFQCIQEEAAELIKATSKAKRFGLWSNIDELRTTPTIFGDISNWNDMKAEFTDLSVLMYEQAKRANGDLDFKGYRKDILVLR